MKGRVKTLDYYGEFEGVKGVDLKHGQKIIVNWPDGRSSREKLTIEDGHGTAQVDMNNYPDHFKTRHLYAERRINGLKVKIPLIGLKIETV